MKLRIDPEFHSLIPPLSADELSQLEANLIAEGCRDPLVVWANEKPPTLLDGHNRYEICTRLNIEFATAESDVETRENALLWIEENQLGRRNLSDDQRSVIADSVRERRSKAARVERAKAAVDTREVKAGRKPILEDAVVPQDKPKERTRSGGPWPVPIYPIRADPLASIFARMRCNSSSS